MSSSNYTWDEFAVDIGARIKAARLAKGMSQEKVARAANIATFKYQKLEKGVARPGAALNPRLTTLVSLCRALDVTIDDLIPTKWPAEIPSVERGAR